MTGKKSVVKGPPVTDTGTRQERMRQDVDALRQKQKRREGGQDSSSSKHFRKARKLHEDEENEEGEEDGLNGRCHRMRNNLAGSAMKDGAQLELLSYCIAPEN